MWMWTFGVSADCRFYLFPCEACLTSSGSLYKSMTESSRVIKLLNPGSTRVIKLLNPACVSSMESKRLFKWDFNSGSERKIVECQIQWMPRWIRTVTPFFKRFLGKLCLSVTSKYTYIPIQIETSNKLDVTDVSCVINIVSDETDKTRILRQLNYD